MINQSLLKAALDVRKNAQAPYSRYFVGSAVQSASGKTYVGCNVERCSYTQTTHAEQNAIDSMIAAEGPVQITAVAVAHGPADQLFEISELERAALVYKPPQHGCCGHCLQIIWENCLNNSDVPISFFDGGKTVNVTTVGTLLPFPFGPTELGIKY